MKVGDRLKVTKPKPCKCGAKCRSMGTVITVVEISEPRYEHRPTCSVCFQRYEVPGGTRLITGKNSRGEYKRFYESRLGPVRDLRVLLCK